MAVSSGPSDQTSSAETTRLGSSTAWRAKWTRQPSPGSGGRSFFRVPGRVGALAVSGVAASSSGVSSFSSEGGTIRKQVRTDSAVALLVACHTASRPASRMHSSSSHSPRAPSGDPRALTQMSTTFALVRRRLAVVVAGLTRSRARASVDRPHQRAQDLVAGFAPLIRERAAPVRRRGDTRRRERGRKGPHERFDPTAVTTVDERAPARPPAVIDEREIGQQPASGQELDHHPDRVGGEADIGPENDAGGIRVRERRIAVSQRRQRAEESRRSGRVEHVPRCRPRREVLLGRRGGMRSAECSGGRLAVERGADRPSVSDGESQRELHVLFSEQVGSRHSSHLDDGQSEKVRIERRGMGLRPTCRATPAGRRRPRPIPVLRPKRQAA